MAFSKAIVGIVIALNMMFVSVVLYINFSGMIVSDTLIVSWFGFTAAELLNLAVIKYQNIKTGTTEVKEGMDQLNTTMETIKSDMGSTEIKKGDTKSAKIIFE